MKKIILFKYVLLLLTAGSLIACNNGSESAAAQSDSSSRKASDSAMMAHQVDPSTAYPQPAVTGSQEDSSRTRDSASFFIKRAVHDHQAIVDLTKLALEKSSSATIKTMADQVNKSHAQFLQSLNSMKPGIVKNEQGPIEHVTDTLTSFTGKAFDRRWVNTMIHEQTVMIQQYEVEESGTKNENIKNFVATALPVIKKQLKQLQTQSKSISY